MKIESKYRGHEIIIENKVWFYKDTKEPVSSNTFRKCGKCGKSNTKEGHDGCLETLKYLMNACCGHGVINESYVQFQNGFCLRGAFSILFIYLSRFKNQFSK